MKNLILLLAIFFSAAQVRSNEEIRLPKKIVKLSDLHDNTEIGCDLCGCYMGLDPNFSYSQLGVRYSLVKFFTEAHTEQNQNVDHEGHEATSSAEYYNDLEFYVRYYFTPKLRLFLTVPFSSNEIEGNRFNGMGDMKLMMQYQVYNSEITSKTNLWQRIFLGGGASIPTGVYNKTVAQGEVEPHFQPGTGSFDLLLTGLHLAKLEKLNLGWRNDVVYTVNGTNKNQYSFGNRFNWTSTFFYEFDTETLVFLPHSGVYFESANQDKLNGTYAAGSGGDVWFWTGGIDTYYNEFSIEFNMQLPFSEKLIGEQPNNDFRIYTGIGYAF